MENDNVIDISDRKELMGRMVESNAVKLVPVGSSGKNYCITMSKNALIALREGRSFPIEMMANGETVKFVLMRDKTFDKQLKAMNKLNTDAKKAADIKVETNKELKQLTENIGNDLKID